MRIYKIKKGSIIQKMEGKTMIFDGEESLLYTLNETASFIFAKIKQGLDGKTIAQELRKKYGIKKERAVRDVGELIGELLKKKIIVQEKSFST